MTNNTENKIIDLEFLNKIIGDDKDFERELFEIFIDNSKFNVNKLQKSIEENDNDSWFMAAHALKGSSASIGAFNFSKKLDAAQKNSSNDINTKIKMLEDIKISFIEVENFIKNKILK